MNVIQLNPPAVCLGHITPPDFRQTVRLPEKQLKSIASQHSLQSLLNEMRVYGSFSLAINDFTFFLFFTC